MERLIACLAMDPSVPAALRDGNLDGTDAELQTCIAAAETLRSAMEGIARLASSDKAALLTMQAVRERVQEFEDMQDDFINRCVRGRHARVRWPAC